VVSAVEVAAVILMFQSVSPSQMTASSRDEDMKFVGSVWRVTDEGFQLEGSQGESGWGLVPKLQWLLCVFACTPSAN
jgi:hypothetical protein